MGEYINNLRQGLKSAFDLLVMKKPRKWNRKKCTQILKNVESLYFIVTNNFASFQQKTNYVFKERTNLIQHKRSDESLLLPQLIHLRKHLDEEIKKLIEALWVNDREEVYDGWEDPEEPTDTIKALIKIRTPVISPLIDVLFRPDTYAAAYACRILGDIGDEVTIPPLIVMLEDIDAVDSEVLDAAKDALRKFGERALEDILYYLKGRGEKEDYDGVEVGLELLEGFKSQAIFETVVSLLSTKNKDIHISVALWLGEYGDKRAVPHLTKLLEDLKTRNAALFSLRKLVGISEYRELITPYVEERMAEYEHNIKYILKDISWAYDDEYGTRFQGDDAESLNFVAKEDEIMREVLRLTSIFARILEEHVLSAPNEVKAIRDAVQALEEKHERFESDHWEELRLTRNEIYGINNIEKRTYSRLASYFDELQSDLVPWLRKQGFQVVWKKPQKKPIFARKGTEAQQIGCIIDFDRPSDLRKTQGTVKIRLWGSEWSEIEVERFQKAFWERIESKVNEVGGSFLDEANA